MYGVRIQSFYFHMLYIRQSIFSCPPYEILPVCAPCLHTASLLCVNTGGILEMGTIEQPVLSQTLFSECQLLKKVTSCLVKCGS